MRTVRSAARARNRPRATLAWLLVVVFGALAAVAALAARAGADALEAGALEADDTLSANRSAPASAGDAAGAPEGAGDGAEDAALADAGRDAGDDADDAALEAAALAAVDAAEAGAEVRSSAALRPGRAPRWGRLDLELVWRRALADAAGDASRDTLWLFATWRR